MEKEHFEMELFSLKENEILNLAVRVCGKKDHYNKYMALNTNREFFDVDVISTLMIYMEKRRNCKSPYLFPGKKGGCFTSTTFAKITSELLTNVLKLKETKNSLFGTHTWRKTGYAFALVGKSY